jgi:hypothetical protein
MINKLLPDQISSMWPVIKYAVEQSLPPVVGEHPDKMNRILTSMLCGKLDVWALYDSDSKKFEAILVTSFGGDENSNTKHLLLYCLYGYSHISNGRWKEGYNTLVEYAKANDCSRIVSYSNSDKVIEMAKSFGADTYTYISFSV